MKFEHLAEIAVPVKHHLQWLWYSQKTDSFLTGDDSNAFAISAIAPASALALGEKSGNSNLPLPSELYNEFLETDWHGFKFADSADGDLLNTLVFLPDYGSFVIHPGTGLQLALKSGSLKLFSGDGKQIDETKTRGKAALAFAGHPTEGMIAYGDNFGTFTAHRFDASGFGKASKIVAKDRKASRIEFFKNGSMIALGGMGYLSTLSHSNGKFVPVHEMPISVRDLLWLDDGERVIVNQGMHGMSAFSYDDTGFKPLSAVKPEGVIQQIATNVAHNLIAITRQDIPAVSIYRFA